MKGTSASQGYDLSIALLVLRIGAGGLLFGGHGIKKLLGYGQMVGEFPDPLGLGSAPSLILAIFAEVLCALLVAAGFMTRLAALPPIATMAVAFFIVHADDPFKVKELALVYLLMFVVIALAGAGRFSIDALLRARRRSR